MADCSVSLDAEITERIMERWNQLPFVSYVVAVDESAQSRKQQKTVLQMAQHQFTREVQNRKEVSENLRSQIDSLKTDVNGQKTTLNAEADRQKTALNAEDNRQADALTGGALRQKNEAMRKAEEWNTSLREGTAVYSVAWGVGIGLVLSCLGQRWLFLPPALLGVLICLFAIGPVWLAKLDRNRKLQQIERDLDDNLSKLDRRHHAQLPELDRHLHDQFVELDQSLAAKLPTLEKSLSAAKARDEKARQALAWLQSQISGNDYRTRT